MRTRILWIDTLKAFAIFTVVAGHMMSCGAFGSNVGKEIYHEFIMAFHMPLFTVLSGWFFSARRSAMEFLRAKGVGILLPYIVWGVVWFFARPLVALMIDGQEVHLSSVVWQANFFVCDGLMRYGWWFLRGLFLTLLLAYGSVKVAERCGNKVARHAYVWGGLVSCIGLYALNPKSAGEGFVAEGFYLYVPFLLGWISDAMVLRTKAGDSQIIEVPMLHDSAFCRFTTVMGWRKRYVLWHEYFGNGTDRIWRYCGLGSNRQDYVQIRDRCGRGYEFYIAFLQNVRC